MVTFYPFELSPELSLSLNHLAAGSEALVLDSWRWLGNTDFILNVLLFLPCGALLYSLWKTGHQFSGFTIVRVTLCGASLSFMIELGQAFVSRDSSGFDVVANTFGTILGALAYARYKQLGIDLISRGTEYLSSRIAVCCVLILGALPLVFSAEQFISPFWRWDSQYTLQFGNETTMNRPWLGKIYLVALYRRALSTDDVKNNFDAGFGSRAVMRRTHDDLIALYEFAERRGDMVHDTAKFGTSLNLKFSPGPRLHWLADPDGIELTRRTIIKSQGPATKLIDALRDTNELSLEVWMAPRNLSQDGPARIVSLSRDPGARNFMLGQEGADIHFRLRTPASGNNGTPVVLKTSNGALTPERAHVVVTYKEGVERLYVNGAERPESVNLMTDAIIGFATRKTPAAQIAYSFFYFFPVAFVISVFFSARSDLSPHSWLYAVAVTVGLSTATELIQALALERAIDGRLFGYGLMIALFGAVSGRAFAGAETCQYHR